MNIKIHYSFFNIILIIILIILIIILLFNLYETEDKYKYNRNIKIDGYKVFDNDDKKEILKNLPKDYVYIDYKYEIKGCTLSTFHRDVTSSQYIYKTKYPVYTLISYYNKKYGPLLALCPHSHILTPYLGTLPVIINGNYSTSILFNCDIIHAGALNDYGKNRHAIQYKICHIDDLSKLSHLIGINKITYGSCNNSNYFYTYLLRKALLYFSYIINYLMTDLLQTKPEKDTIVEYIVNNFFIGDFYNK